MKIENTLAIEQLTQVTRSADGKANASSEGGASFASFLDSQIDAFLKPLQEEFAKGSSGTVSQLSNPAGVSMAEGTQGMGKFAAKKIVNFLDRTGFLNKVVDNVVESSGKASWVNGSMREDLKIELGKTLEETFSEMDWSEAMQFIMELNLKVTHGNLSPMPFESVDESPKTVYEEIEYTMQKQIDKLTDSLK